MPAVRVISALGCRPCERVKIHLEELQARHTDLIVEDVDMLTDDGIALAARHRVWTLPTLIIDDTIVAEGDVELPDLEAALGFVPSGS
jgi:DNA-binding LytR/AlgR family response regulator